MNLRRLFSCFLIMMSLAGLRAAPVIDSVAAVASVCANNGKLTIYAHGAGPLTYTIISGPVTHGAQASDIFGALAPGTYTIQVSDGAGSSVTVTRTITGGTYVPPTFTPYVVYPKCKQSHDLLLVGHLDPGTGAGPVMWQMSAPVNTAYQNSDTFHIQEPGSYTISCADVCGSIQTTTYTFAYDFEPNILPGVIMESLLGCDSVSIDLSASVNGTDQNVVFPYTLSLHNSRGAVRTFTQTSPVLGSVVTAGSASFAAISGSIDMINTMPHHHGDTMYAMMIDGCGDTITDIVTIPVVDTAVTYDPIWSNHVTGTCQVANENDFSYTQSKPNTWVVINDLTHHVAASGTNLPDPAHVSTANTVTLQNLPGDTSYMLLSIDACSDTVRTHFVWPYAATTPRTYKEAEIAACLDGTGTESILYSGFTSGVTLEVLSGPSGASSTTPGYEFTQHYTYPKLFYGPPGGTFILEDLAQGTYKFRLHDSCGTVTAIDSFAIIPAFSVSFSHSVIYKPGCNNANKIFVEYISPDSLFAAQNVFCAITDSATGAIIFTGANSYRHFLYGAVYNVPAGTYYVSAQYAPYDTGFSMADVAYCNHVLDTLIIPQYISPALSSLTAVNCSGSLSIDAEIDLTTGLGPYTYAITAGPQTFPAQSGHVFAIQQYGVYTVQVLDACGNAVTRTVSIDSLTGAPLRVFHTLDSCFHAIVAGQVYTAPTVLTSSIKSVAGCDSIVYIDSVLIRGSGDVPPLSVVRDTFCRTTGGMLSASPSYTSYLWNDGTTTPTITVSQPGAYILRVTDGQGCSLADTALVAFVDSPYITDGWVASATVCPDDPLRLHLSVNEPNAQYLWDRTDAAQYSLDRTVTDSGIYTFSISNQCAATSYTLIAAGKECDEKLYVPNAFTPNGDGVNDIFLMSPSYDLKITVIRIFDRWGEMVYQSEDPKQGWDGSYKGTPQSAGIYVYEVDAVWPTGRAVHKKGSLTLLK